ncbi:hypothetical protein [Enterococcus pallens]|uniref:Uncharacterized protein n=1 Tax=Enterococcus pallens ATCC BAA-351 TaxID=1158607 RepID=R2S0I9_9ENTE|nr:hypothetical protein [Enterococcus pallens]EOH86336.1 hypothetical protein UAU_05258 [Enterococcus pallens ATCC BAA-351]EOU09443.1 hypothetical protein I588_05176 [Enterococcus pallens ATCC BAA-351]
MAEIISFSRAKSRAQSTYNPLEAWRCAFLEELMAAEYSTSVPDELFPNSKIDDSKNLYELNTKVETLLPGEKLVLVRNHHFELFFYYSYENELTLRIGSLISGIDAVFLQDKFSNEKRIFKKYYQFMLGYFGK